MRTEPSPRPRRRGVRRLIRLTIICILLGVLTTLAVAWSLAAWLPHSKSITSSWVGPDPSPSRMMTPGTYVLIDEYVQGGACRRLTYAHPLPCLHIQALQGWPLLALTCDIELLLPPQHHTFRALDGIELEPLQCGLFDLPNARALPLRPIPRGFAINTAFYATLWFLILFAPRALRRHLRTIRGHCPRCAYDLTTLPSTTPCPECGTPQLP